MSLFEKNVMELVDANQSVKDTGLPIHLTKLSKFVNYIERSKNYIIGGRPESGKASFMDHTYLLEVFKWWRDLGYDDEGHKKHAPNRPPLKIIYFNMKKTEQVKLQKLLCLYLKLEYNYVMDIPTLMNTVGKTYNLENKHLSAIKASQSFFEELEEHMEIISGAQSPTDINLHVKRIMSQYGSNNEQGVYTFDKKYQGQYTLIYIDDLDYLLPESDGYQTLGQEGLEKRLGDYLLDFKKVYKSSNFVIKPTKVMGSRVVKDSEPSYKDLGNIGKIADIGLVLYNPFNENNLKYLNYPIESLFIKGKNRFRTVSIVRNPLGISNITVGLLFLGECGYMRESPHPSEEEDFGEFIALFRALP